MKKKIAHLKFEMTRRRFSFEFKNKIVQDFKNSKLSQKKLGEKYGLDSRTIGKWLKKDQGIFSESLHKRRTFRSTYILLSFHCIYFFIMIFLNRSASSIMCLFYNGETTPGMDTR